MSEWRNGRNTDYFSEKKYFQRLCDILKRIKRCLVQYFIVKNMCFVNKKAYLIHVLTQFYVKTY